MNGCASGSALWVGKLKHREPGRRDCSLLCTPIVLQEHPINPQGDAPRPAAGREPSLQPRSQVTEHASVIPALAA